MNTEPGVHFRHRFLQSSTRLHWSLGGYLTGKATASWQWFNWTLQRVPAGKKALRINMDETCCRLFYEAGPGVLGSEPIAASARKGFITQQVTRKQKRGALSLLGMLCDDSGIQAILPQVIIGNEKCLPEAERKTLMETRVLMRNVTVLRRKSAWATDQSLSEVVPIWGKALEPYRRTHQPILMLDACTAHMGLRFLRACARWDIWLSSCLPRRHGCCSQLTHTASPHSRGAFDRCSSSPC